MVPLVLKSLNSILDFFKQNFKFTSIAVHIIKVVITLASVIEHLKSTTIFYCDFGLNIRNRIADFEKIINRF